MEKTHQFI